MYHIAIDLGATSGRIILGKIQNEKLETQEVYRFPNKFINIHNKFYWNIYSLYEHIIHGLKQCSNLIDDKEVTIGVDTWGVDFVCIDKNGQILGLPRSYRDPYTNNISSEFFKNCLSNEELYNITGIQTMDINTLFQIYALKNENSVILENTHKILFMPDAITFMLTGKIITEYSIATTSQLLNAQNKTFDNLILEKLGIPSSLFNPITHPGTIIGDLSDNIREETNLKNIDVKIIAVAGHDTASAIVAIPSIDENFAYISSGTWSLMGIESENPIISPLSYQYQFTNEGGAFGKITFLKNITGMWILEQCRKEWEEAGQKLSYSELTSKVTELKFQSIINPDDQLFQNPKSMTEAIKIYCQKTNQKVPSSIDDFVNCIFESMVLKYKQVFNQLKEVTTQKINRLHIIGGGSQNDVLNQLIADALNIEVIAGPVEATSMGNIMLQAYAMKIIDSQSDIRKLIQRTTPLKSFLPTNSNNWEKALNECKKFLI